MARRLALIDADIFAYVAASSTEERFRWPDEEAVAIETGDSSAACASAVRAVEEVRRNLKAARLVLAFSCPSSENFRRRLLPEYKANRGAKPLHLQIVKDHLTREYETKTRPHIEADDILGMLATSAPAKGWQPIIVSIDKDLMQVPGLHAHPDNGVLREQDTETGNRVHILQTLTGDSTDNYKGCPGIGPVKAAKLLTTPDGAWYPPGAWWDIVVGAYESKGLTEADALVQARVARILQHGDYNDKTGEIRLWEPQER